MTASPITTRLRFLFLGCLLSFAVSSSSETTVDPATTGGTCTTSTTTTATSSSTSTIANGTEADTLSSSSSSSSTANHQEALVEWLVSKKGGFFSDKVKFQPLFAGGPNGMFAMEDIAQNETILIIPFECLLTSDFNGRGPSFDLCDTTRHLVQEYQKLQTTGDSFFAPYINYIFDQKQYNKIPAAWSEPARMLLREIIGHELEPQAVDANDFWLSCATEPERARVYRDPDRAQLYTDAYRTVISRSWNDVMIPVYDMVNHRNGHYHNIDQLTSAHSNNDVVIVTLRDVQKGEQLYISYNECQDLDCEGIAQSYILPQIMKDYGFVEQYPRRWSFSEDPDTDDDSILFELNADEQTGEITLSWLNDNEPDRHGYSYLRGHLHRQLKLHDEWTQRANQLTASYERDTILEYHQALITALQMALQETGQDNSILDTIEQTCTPQQECAAMDISGRYSDLAEKPHDEARAKDAADYTLCAAVHTRYRGDAPYELLDETKSFYQPITFEHNEQIDDTCLYLSGWLQTCTSWRAHYHESIVHVSASFLDNVTRVAILGGGDNMMMHEVLKYENTLELVLDMELDQQVVRSSFRNLGTQPHFDNPKVQWWFGDATKSLSLLPHHYFGTFDLVLVDLQTNLVEILQVTPTKTIMDVAMDLLKPTGIIARNEDYYPRRSIGFAKYEVDLEYLDVPQLCQQSITIGSKTVDFMAKTPKDHGIDSLYFKYNSQKYHNWFNYRNNKDKVFVDEPGEINSPDGMYGVHLIFEVEHAVLKKNGADETRKSISKALSDVGFAEMSVAVSDADGEATVVFLFLEGYLLAQFWPQRGYAGFDLKLWTQEVDKQEAAKNKIAEAIHGHVTTSFRVVTGGMSGQEQRKKTNTETKQVMIETEEAATVEKITEEKQLVDLTEDVFAAIVVEALSLMQAPDADAIVAVVCPEKAARCKTLESLYKHNIHFSSKIIPVYTCPGLTDESMFACERSVESGLHQDVRTVDSVNLINGILFDPEVPKAMGQIMHLLLNDKWNRIKMLESTYVVMYTSHESTPSWQRGLLERCQDDFDPFSPALRSEVVLNSTSESIELGVFSSGNPNFYATLEKMLESVKTKTGLSWEVNHVEDGHIGYVAEFHPRVMPSNADYDKTDSLKQWSTQSQVGHQTIFQFGIQHPLESLEVHEIVLVEYIIDVWKGQWIPGRVLKKRKGEKYILEVDGEEELEVERSNLRKLDFASKIEVMDQVLIRQGHVWTQGAVIEKLPRERSYKVRRFDSDGDVVIVKRMDMIPRMEANDKSHKLPSLMTVNLSDAVKAALLEANIDLDVEKDVQVFWGIGSGCVIAAFWSSGSAVATWDGQGHLDVTMFTDEENGGIRNDFVEALMEEIPALALTSRNDHPRGLGRVVNFQSDLEESPVWVESFEDAE